MHDQGGLGKCKVGTPHSHEGLGVGMGTNRWCVCVRIGGVISLWFVRGMRWRIGQWWCMIKRMGNGNYEV
jgi:hypothetical protein